MSDSLDRSELIGTHLPFLRRYGRALTGSQSSGDAYAVATLEAILHDATIFDEVGDPRVGLFKVFHSIWTSSGAPVNIEESGPRAAAQDHLKDLTVNTREALLLNTIEELSFAQVATVMDIKQDEAEELIIIAKREMMESVTGRVMIIEDEPIIADDIEAIVEHLGHDVVGIARTRTEAVALGTSEKPDLILADIQLADNSSGIDAVNDLISALGDVPVIFITAFPERLLTGEKHEPAFLITKPFNDEQVRSAVSQAMFFASTQTLKA
ncbi:response regulator receiver protein [Litoreibacter halocynthiae]|uniref:Response regulator receiver protein n=1 Tax=Litoreibacter halocynthiae TaxID=1242689 RepID=A0A4R7LIV2_9RHOB|nr:response regulator [Litoreibacter halocynthiae]TDT74301.1 response regulator receiver protein [Litoreibacter halocynthiae]